MHEPTTISTWSIPCTTGLVEFILLSLWVVYACHILKHSCSCLLCQYNWILSCQSTGGSVGSYFHFSKMWIVSGQCSGSSVGFLLHLLFECILSYQSSCSSGSYLLHLFLEWILSAVLPTCSACCWTGSSCQTNLCAAVLDN